MNAYRMAIAALFILSAGCGSLMAQDPAGADSSRKSVGSDRSYFEASLNYQSNNVYLGRKDSTALPYFIPMFSYYHKSGIYISASAAYLHHSTVSRVDEFTLEAGYSFSAGNYSGDFTASRYFYNSQSTSVTAEIKGALSGQGGYDLGFIRPTFAAVLSFGNKPDFEGSFGLEHSFSFGQGKLEITPAVQANGSTLNYYSNYYKTRRFARKGKKAVTGTVAITGTVESPSEFRILDYEASLPITYKTGKFKFSFTPLYALPVDPAVIDLHYAYSTGTTADKKNIEKTGDSFFWTLGVSYRL
jgi:hypothetical protein